MVFLNICFWRGKLLEKKRCGKEESVRGERVGTTLGLLNTWTTDKQSLFALFIFKIELGGS